MDADHAFTMSPRVPQNEELAEDLARIERKVDAVHNRLDRLNEIYVPREVFDIQMERLNAAQSKTDERVTFAARTAMTAAVLPLIVAIVAAIILAGGPR